MINASTPLRELKRSAGTVRVLLIRSGPGNAAGRSYFTPEALTKAVEAGVFDGAQSYFDHPSKTEDRELPERSVSKLCGWFDNIEAGAYKDPTLGDCTGVYADFHPLRDNSTILGLLATAAAYAKKYPAKSYIGFSINALGSGEQAEINGQPYNRVDEISEVTSVDVVTRAGAGGRALSFSENYRAAREALGTGLSLVPDCLESADGPTFSLAEAHLYAVTPRRRAPNCLGG